MAVTHIEPSRVQSLNTRSVATGAYVLYWMQQSQRAEHNHALEYAVGRANELGQPLLVGFGLMDDYPEANLRHYRFMLEGLRETQQALHRRQIRLVVQNGNPDQVALQLGRKASLLVCDRGYLRHQKRWRDRVARAAGCAVVQVEADVVVPVDVATDKAAIGARTLRPRVGRHREEYLVDLGTIPVARGSLDLSVKGLDLGDVDVALAKLKLDRSVGVVPLFRGGTSEAKQQLRQFLQQDLQGYAGQRNQPGRPSVSHMSKYLHFGQISPVYLALQIRDAAAPPGDRATYLEELLVRRELAQNFVHFTEDYDDFAGLPAWARDTLHMHRRDPRPHVYTREQLIAAQTHDPYWNAAMQELRYTGYMHNYMRMYWGKKILEWGRDPEEAYRTALALNNTYFLDGRDANSYANVGWVFGLHDRPWPERPIYGNVRSMTAGGLERKTDVRAYVIAINAMVQSLGLAGAGPTGV